MSSSFSDVFPSGHLPITKVGLNRRSGWNSRLRAFSSLMGVDGEKNGGEGYPGRWELKGLSFRGRRMETECASFFLEDIIYY